MKTLYLLLASVALLAVRGYPIKSNPVIRQEVAQLLARGFYVPPDPDLIIRGVVIDSEYPIRAADDSQGWLGAKILVTAQEGRTEPTEFAFVRGLGYERPSSGDGSVIFQSHRDYLIRAQNGEGILVFLRKNSQLTRWCSVPVYNNMYAYKIEK